MPSRKIQLIAGTTYTVSLPKDWVLKNHLKEKKEVMLEEGPDQTLVISPGAGKEQRKNSISIKIDEHMDNLKQLLLAVYYLGYEDIRLSSASEMPKQSKMRIRQAVSNLSGTEIVYEDKREIRINVLLDKSKIRVPQLLYRMMLILEVTISNIIESNNQDEIRLNEEEMDRLYNLLTKMLSLSLTNPGIMVSSEIYEISLIPNLFLISKKMENIHDDLLRLSDYLAKKKPKKEVLEWMKVELNRSIAYFSKERKVFRKADLDLNKKLAGIDDQAEYIIMKDLLRQTLDIEKEIVKISIYRMLR